MIPPITTVNQNVLLGTMYVLFSILNLNGPLFM